MIRRALFLVFAAVIVIGCGDDDSGTVPVDGGVRDGMTTSDCTRFAFEASGTASCDEGCSISCPCPAPAFPISIASCKPEGCIVAASCDEVCAAGLETSLDCTDTYTVRAGGSDGGTDAGTEMDASPPPVDAAEGGG